MSYQHRPTAQRGFTAIELIIVLIIGFSIIGLSASKMGEMMTSSKAVRAMDSIISLSTAIKALNSPQGYGAANDDLIILLINSDTAPKSLKRGPNNTLINQWNANITATVNDPNVHDFTITYPGIPKAACNKLVKDLLSNFTVTINNAGAPAVVGQQSTVAQIVNACNVAPQISLVLNDL